MSLQRAPIQVRVGLVLWKPWRGAECFLPLPSRGCHGAQPACIFPWSAPPMCPWPPPGYRDPSNHIARPPDNPGSPSLDLQLHHTCKAPQPSEASSRSTCIGCCPPCLREQLGRSSRQRKTRDSRDQGSTDHTQVTTLLSLKASGAPQARGMSDPNLA